MKKTVKRLLCCMLVLGLTGSMIGCGGKKAEVSDNIVNVGVTDSLGGLNPLTVDQTEINKNAIEHVCMKARDMKNVKAVSFNFHTPYPDTKELALSKEEKAECCDVIRRMMKEGAPVFNLKSAFPYLINNNFPTPCHQCVVMENGKLSTCGRCIDVPGLCEECGCFFVAEYTLLFGGHPLIILEMLMTYLKYI